MEIEAKFALTVPVKPEQIEALDWRPYRLGPRETIDQHDTFFDTAELALSQTRHAVRLREGGAALIVTMKGPGTVANGVHARDEWETPVTERPPAVWPADIRARLDQLIGDQPLQPLLHVHNLRRIWPIFYGDAVIGELALDEGSIAARERQEPMHELEIELKGGTRDDIAALSAYVQQYLPAQPENRSKFARGLALLASTTRLPDIDSP